MSSVEEELVDFISIGRDGVNVQIRADIGQEEGSFRQAMTGTVSLYNKAGKRLKSIYIAHPPQFGKENFDTELAKEIENVALIYPKAIRIGLADGAKDNWIFLEKYTHLNLIDYYHASQKLSELAECYYSNENERNQWVSQIRERLKIQYQGAEKILKEIKILLQKDLTLTQRKTIQSVITYFENNHHRMHYWKFYLKNYPIGSGVTEAACKTVVKQRASQAARFQPKMLHVRRPYFEFHQWQSLYCALSHFQLNHPKPFLPKMMLS